MTLHAQFLQHSKKYVCALTSECDSITQFSTLSDVHNFHKIH